MSDDAPIRSGEGDWEEDATTVMSRNRRAPESEPPAPDREDYVVEATMRIRPDQVDRRALPFRQGGGPDRRRRRGTAADRRTADPSPAATRDADPVAEQAPFTRSDPPPAEQRGSVWSQPPLAVDPKELPSALAPTSNPPPAPRAAPAGSHAQASLWMASRWMASPWMAYLLMGLAAVAALVIILVALT